jgi:hypothetical protein
MQIADFSEEALLSQEFQAQLRELSSAEKEEMARGFANFLAETSEDRPLQQRILAAKLLRELCRASTYESLLTVARSPGEDATLREQCIVALEHLGLGHPEIQPALAQSLHSWADSEQLLPASLRLASALPLAEAVGFAKDIALSTARPTGLRVLALEALRDNLSERADAALSELTPVIDEDLAQLAARFLRERQRRAVLSQFHALLSSQDPIPADLVRQALGHRLFSVVLRALELGLVSDLNTEMVRGFVYPDDLSRQERKIVRKIQERVAS